MTAFYYSSINGIVVFSFCNKSMFDSRSIFFSLTLLTHIKQWNKSNIKDSEILKELSPQTSWLKDDSSV